MPFGRYRRKFSRRGSVGRFSRRGRSFRRGSFRRGFKPRRMRRRIVRPIRIGYRF